MDQQFSVSIVGGCFRVVDVRSRQEFKVQKLGKRDIGACSCGRPAPASHFYMCPHQRAASEMMSRRWLAGWARSGLFHHPERLTLEFERRQERLVRLLGRHSRAGHLDCPHCGKAITAEDLEGAQPRDPPQGPSQGQLFGKGRQ